MKAQKGNKFNFDQNSFMIFIIFVLEDESDESETSIFKTLDDDTEHWENLKAQKNSKVEL